MRSKFPPPPPHQLASSRPQPPLANEISEELVLRGVQAFKRGTGAGPSGLRPDFVRQVLLCSDGVNAEGLTNLTHLVNLLANGEAPPQLQPYLGGAKGTAGDKTSKAGLPDARPLCSGEFFRRLVSRCLLYTELDTLRNHLLPHQLAVAVSAGGEVLTHVCRQWRDDYASDVNRI